MIGDVVNIVRLVVDSDAQSTERAALEELSEKYRQLQAQHAEDLLKLKETDRYGKLSCLTWLLYIDVESFTYTTDSARRWSSRLSINCSGHSRGRTKMRPLERKTTSSRSCKRNMAAWRIRYQLLGLRRSV